MDFFNNNVNDNIKFKINAEGVEPDSIQPRLVFMGEGDVNYIIFGNIEENVCTFEVPELKMYESGNTGKVRLELIAEEQYYNIWEDDFGIKSKKIIKMDEMVTEAVKKVAPKIEVSQVKVEPVNKKKEEPKKVEKKPVKKEEPKKVVKQPIKESKTTPKKVVKPVESKNNEFVSLNDYLKQ